MRKFSTAVLVVCLGLAAWATPASAELSATGKVIAILAGDLFVGEAVGHLDGAGTLAIHSQKDPALTCNGQFTSSAALGGQGKMQCSDGATATFSFKRLNIFRGYGVGNFDRGTMSFAYGFTAEEAGPYLRLPEGKQLRRSGAELTLVDE
jgi:hypothetical protein